MNRERRNQVIEVIDAKIAPIAYRCAEVEWVSHERILRIYIEHLDGKDGIVMDDCLSVNRVLAEFDDLDNMILGSYRLEVSSPGVERPLRTVQHFEGVKGKTVRVKLVKPIHNRSEGYGVVVNVEGNEPVIELETQNGSWKFSLAEVSSANLIYDW